MIFRFISTYRDDFNPVKRQIDLLSIHLTNVPVYWTPVEMDS